MPRVPSGVRLFAFLVGAAPALAQAPSAPTPAATPRPGVVAAEEVTVLTLDVVAVDGKNRPVFGLVPTDFEVRVAGKIQTIDFFEPPRGGAPGVRPGEGRPDSEERIAGTTTPFAPGATVRHVLVWVDLEQLPRRSILDTAEALHKAFDHAPSGRYGIATHFGGVSARVWDADSVEAFLTEADGMSAEVATSSEGAVMKTPGAPRASGGRGADSPIQYEARKLYETQLIDELIGAETAQGDMRMIIQAINDYLVGERRRVKTSVEDLRETAERLASLEGPRHLFYVSEGFEKVPGFNFLARLRAEESARVRTSGASAGSFGPPTGGRGGMPGTAFAPVPGAAGTTQALGSGRFVFDPSPLYEADDLARWLAASGVTLHFLDPGGLGRELPSAADKYSFNSGLRRDDARNLQETPLRYATETGGLSRLSTNDVSGALAEFVDATSATYRIGVRLQGVDPKKTYTVRVGTRKAGVNMLARSAFKPAAGGKTSAAATLTEDARRAGAASRADDRRAGPARAAKKALPVTLEWKGRASTPSPDPAKPFWKLEVRIPHEELKFDTESDAFVASVKIAVNATAVEGAAHDTTTDDWFLSYSGDEYKEVRDTPAVRSVTLQLPPGKYDLTVSVNDALGGTYGQSTLRIDAR
jgi:hypothetical protein